MMGNDGIFLAFRWSWQPLGSCGPRGPHAKPTIDFHYNPAFCYNGNQYPLKMNSRAVHGGGGTGVLEGYLLSELDSKIKEYAKLHKQYKAVSAKLDTVKTYFRDEAGGEDMTFEASDGTIVKVTREQQNRWDSPRLMQKLGGHADKFKKTSEYLKVHPPMKPDAKAS